MNEFPIERKRRDGKALISMSDLMYDSITHADCVNLCYFGKPRVIHEKIAIRRPAWIARDISANVSP